MKSLRAALLALAGVLCVTPAVAAEQAPFLWRLEGPNATHYLLGSMHMLPDEAYPLPPALDAAYAASQRIVLETDIAAINSPAMQMALLQAATQSPGSSLSEQLDTRDLQRLRQRITELGLPAQVCEPLKAWLCAVTLEVVNFQRAGFDPARGIDQHYDRRARQDGKTIDWLEAPEAHIALLTEMSEQTGTALLLASLEDTGRAEADPRRLYEAWRDSDAALMSKEFERMRTEHPKAYARLIANRNATWLKQLPKDFDAEESTMLIVGAGHLIGADGLIPALQRLGYNVTPITR